MTIEKLAITLASLNEVEREIISAREENDKTLEAIRAAKAEYKLLALEPCELPE